MAESFNPQGVSDWLFVTALADPAAPTDAELVLGTKLGQAVVGVTAPARTPNTIESTPLTADSTHTLPALPGTTNGELELQRGDKSTAATYTLFNTMKAKEGDDGFLVKGLRGKADGFVAGGIVDVYPATVNTVSAANSAPGAAETWKVSFSHNGSFHENVLIVAD